MHCLIKEISIFWQSSFGLCDFFPKGTDIAPGFFRTVILCVDMFFTHWPLLFIFSNAKYLTCHFWQKVLVIKEETKWAWSKLLERHTRDGTAVESSFFSCKELRTSPHANLMNTGGSTYFPGPGKQMWSGSARFTTRIISWSGASDRLPTFFCLLCTWPN